MANNIFVYGFQNGLMDLTYFNSIPDAIRHALSLSDAYVIDDGVRVDYKLISPNCIAYIQGNGKMKKFNLVQGEV